MVIWQIVKMSYRIRTDERRKGTDRYWYPEQG